MSLHVNHRVRGGSKGYLGNFYKQVARKFSLSTGMKMWAVFIECLLTSSPRSSVMSFQCACSQWSFSLLSPTIWLVRTCISINLYYLKVQKIWLFGYWQFIYFYITVTERLMYRYWILYWDCMMNVWWLYY